LLEPQNWVIVAAAGIGWHSGSIAGLAWAAAGALCAVVAPVMITQEARRQARLADWRTDPDEHKLTALGLIIMSMASCLALQLGFGAPGQVVTLTITMLALTAALLTAARSWRISVRATVISAATLLLAFSYGPLLLLLYGAVAWAARSKEERSAYTWPQTAAGLTLGTLTPAAIYVLLH
jgi:hypothetical protein